eukprot:SAG31_NODE_5706_length_2369_cov_25.244934_5_plen_141_part_00
MQQQQQQREQQSSAVGALEGVQPISWHLPVPDGREARSATSVPDTSQETPVLPAPPQWEFGTRMDGAPAYQDLRPKLAPGMDGAPAYQDLRPKLAPGAPPYYNDVLTQQPLPVPPQRLPVTDDSAAAAPGAQLNCTVRPC